MNHVARIIRQFGSQQALGAILTTSQSAISDWVRAGHIPARHQRAILLAARERGLDITAEDLIGVERTPQPAAEMREPSRKTVGPRTVSEEPASQPAAERAL